MSGPYAGGGSWGGGGGAETEFTPLIFAWLFLPQNQNFLKIRIPLCKKPLISQSFFESLRTGWMYKLQHITHKLS